MRVFIHGFNFKGFKFCTEPSYKIDKNFSVKGKLLGLILQADSLVQNVQYLSRKHRLSCVSFITGHVLSGASEYVTY